MHSFRYPRSSTQSPAPLAGERHYGWFRHFNGFVRDARWKLVATRTGLKRETVIAVVFDIHEHANQTMPRGSVEEFLPEVCAAALDLERETVEKICAVLEEIQVIDQGWIVEWHKIAREKEDATSTERSRKRRKLLREKKEGAAEARLAVIRGAGNAVDGGAATDATALHDYLKSTPSKNAGEAEGSNAVAGGAATPRPDQIQNQDRVADVPKNSADQIEARRWIQGTPDAPGEGALIVAGTLSKDPDFAQYLLQNWATNLGGDYVALKSILQGAKDLRGARFQAVVHGRIVAAKESAEIGPSLPFGPTSVMKTAGG
jgi:hypothetical protein